MPSDANFVLFGGLDDEQATWTALLDHGVLIRDVGLPGHLRVTAGTERETTAFLTALARSPADRAEQGERVSRRSATGRVGAASRATAESRVEVELDLDGTGTSRIATGVPFYDHMLTALSTHSMIDLTVAAPGRRRGRRPPHASRTSPS